MFGQGFVCLKMDIGIIKIRAISGLLHAALAIGMLVSSNAFAEATLTTNSMQTGNDAALLRLPSISATYREFHNDSGVELSQSRVHLSPIGMRVEQQESEVKTAVYYNFQTGQMWFLNLDRSVVHEIPLEQAVPSDMTAEQSQAFRLGFVDTTPCSNLKGVRRSTVRWRGRLVSLWDCYLTSDKAVAMQHFDDSIGLVVRSEYVDGVVMQLENVQDRQFDNSFFVPSKKYRAVTMHELITGAAKIEKYRQ